MTQFSVYLNTNSDTKAVYPLLLDIQNDLIAELATRVVVPLCPASVMNGKLMTTLTPVFDIEDKPYVMLTPQLAGVAIKQLGAKTSDLAQQRNAIIAALDMLITGL
jgi:toxin CcdB